MHIRSLGLAVTGLAALGGCAQTPATAPVTQNGWQVWSGDHTAVKTTCGPQPVRLNGSHTDVKLTGACRLVQLAGDHNDVEVWVAAGGEIEITGSHNDVWWHQAGRGRPPRLENRGKENDFHRARS